MLHAHVQGLRNPVMIEVKVESKDGTVMKPQVIPNTYIMAVLFRSANACLTMTGIVGSVIGMWLFQARSAYRI